MSKDKEARRQVESEQMKDFSSTTKIAPDRNEKDELYNPFEHRDRKHATSDIGSVTHMIKSSLGTGILAMPNAVRNGGLVIGGLGTIIIGILCSHCIHILVRSSQELCKRTKRPQMTYSETAATAIECGPKPIRPFAGFARNLVNAALCATYIGGTCVYIVFLASSMKQLGDFYTDMNIPKRTYMLCLLPAVIPLGQIRKLKLLVPFSHVANFCLGAAFAITAYYVFSDIRPMEEINVLQYQSLPKFFATVIFAIEGIGVVMPIENNMANPSHFLGCPGVLNLSMTVVISLYTAMGIFGYLHYGEKVLAVVTLNLPRHEILGQAVQILVVIAILLTYGLQFFVPLEIIWNASKDKFAHEWRTLAETLLRVLIVLLTVGVAMLVPELEPFISLVGSIFFSFLGICIPAIVETICCWDGHLGAYYWRVWKNALLVLMAGLALVSGSWVSILDIIALYQEHPVLALPGNFSETTMGPTAGSVLLERFLESSTLVPASAIGNYSVLGVR